jgi:phage shock protein A
LERQWRGNFAIEDDPGVRYYTPIPHFPKEVAVFQRLVTLFRGFLGLFISGLEQSNPRALIEAEKENLRRQIARFNDNLANHAGFVERLLRQVKNLEQKERELTARTAANLKAGNRAVAGQLALELQTIKGELEENRQQLVMAEETYQKLVKSRDVSVREAQAKIEKLRRLLTETEMAEAQAELQEMAAGMVSQIGGAGDTINRAEQYLEERRDKAAGRSRVASSQVDTSQVELKEAEQEALATQALAEFEAAFGFGAAQAPQTQGEAPSPPPQKELGPAAQG